MWCNYLSSGFLGADQFTASVSGNTEQIIAADAEDVTENLHFKGGKHQTKIFFHKENVSSSLTCIIDADSGFSL